MPNIELLDGFEAPLGKKYRCVAFGVDKLNVYVYSDRRAMGEAAAYALAENIRKVVDNVGHFNSVWAAAPSHDDIYASLVEDVDVPWEKARHCGMMDEYVGLRADDPRSFRWYHNKHLWGPLYNKGRALKHQVIREIEGDSEDPDAVIREQEKIVMDYHPHIVQCGIGRDNAHIAFNDPPEAYFNDPQKIKIIELADAAKRQQVCEGHFKHISEVPKAFTLTIPALTRYNPDWGIEHTVSYCSCVVPTIEKATAVEKMVLGPITEEVPATILRTLPNAALFLKVDAAWLLHEKHNIDLKPISR